VLRRAVLPYLRRLGERWEKGTASVAQEHFASALLRERLMAMGRGWDRGDGPRALLACPPGERHDIGLVAFGLAARKLGWRVTFLGADTPIDTLAAASAELEPEAVVLSAVVPERFWSVTEALRPLAGQRRLYVGAAGADERVAADIGARLLGETVLEAPHRLRPESKL
jgi:MerR family transcriptional regulator, light-induced transcriptional regulator